MALNYMQHTRQERGCNPFLVTRITEYYSAIDAKDFDRALTLFDDRTTYQRGDIQLSGKASLRHFYRHVRKLNGSHTINSMKQGSTSSSIEISGQFIPANPAEQMLVFTDSFTFNAKGKVVERTTTFKD